MSSCFFLYALCMLCQYIWYWGDLLLYFVFIPLVLECMCIMYMCMLVHVLVETRVLCCMSGIQWQSLPSPFTVAVSCFHCGYQDNWAVIWEFCFRLPTWCKSRDDRLYCCFWFHENSEDSDKIQQACGTDDLSTEPSSQVWHWVLRYILLRLFLYIYPELWVVYNVHWEMPCSVISYFNSMTTIKPSIYIFSFIIKKDLLLLPFYWKSDSVPLSPIKITEMKYLRIFLNSDFFALV